MDMIRGVIGLFFFAVALCAYIVISPGSDRPQDPIAITTAEVSRAQTERLLPGVPLPNDTNAATPPQEPAPAETEDPVVTLAPQAPVIVTDESTILGTTSGVLAGLGLEVDNIGNAPDGEMAKMTDDVLANIGAITGGPIRSTRPRADTALERLIVAALKEGRPDSEIDQMVNAAAIAGELSVPEVLVTADGKVDTHVLLKSIVVQATIAQGGAEPEVPNVPEGEATGVEVRVVQRAEETEQYRFYTVSEGDSLGAIAVKFYGNVDKFPIIFEANRNILSSPNNIRVGQRLTIPRLPEA